MTKTHSRSQNSTGTKTVTNSATKSQRLKANRNQTKARIPKRKAAEEVIFEKQTFIQITPPNMFSLVRGTSADTELTIDFLNELESNLLAKRKVIIDFSKMRKFTTDATLALRSRLVGKSAVFAYLPSRKLVRNKLFACGFFGGDIDLEKETDGTVKLPHGKIRRKERGTVWRDSHNEMLPKIASELIHFATNHLYGEERDFDWVQSILIECMLNTFQHASESDEKETWWASVYFDEKSRIARFNFLDNGIGVLERVKQKYKEIYPKPIPWKTDTALLKAALNGELPPLKPENDFGGTGLRHIGDINKANGIRNLIVISNETVGRINKNDYDKITSKFSGSFFHWEIGVRQRKHTKTKCS